MSIAMLIPVCPDLFLCCATGEKGENAKELGVNKRLITAADPNFIV